MKFRLLALLLSVVLLLTCFAGCAGDTADTPTETTSTGDQTGQDNTDATDDKRIPVKEDRLPEVSGSKIRMYYDDRLALAELSANGGAVEIADQKPVSKQVGTDTLDKAVVVYDEENKQLIAVGVGTAKVTVAGTQYELSVESAPISLFMITGHSIGAGQEGDPAQSILCAPGTAYSTYGTRFSPANLSGVGIGYGSDSKPDTIDAFTTPGEGTLGGGSGIAYNWHKLTGEKAWVLNTAVGGSCLNEWTSGQPNYKVAVRVFQSAQMVLANEIEAGHYRLKDMAIIYHSAANFGYKNVKYTQEDLQKWYDKMWNGYKKDLAMDMDGDGKKDTVNALGFVPIWTTNNVRAYADDKPANYVMGSSKEYPDMFMASLGTKLWIRAGAIPAIDYTTVKTPVEMPKQTSQFFADGTHLTQVVYNAQGIDTAANLYAHLREQVQAESVTFEKPDCSQVTNGVALRVGASITLVPQVTPYNVSDLTYTVSDNLSVSYPCVITGKAAGTGTLTVSQGDRVVATLTIEVKG